MKRNIILLLVLCSFLLTGCIETLEEIYLNKDGSGKYSITFDMSEFFGNPMMKGLIEEAAQEEGVDSTFALGEVDTVMMLGQGADAEAVMGRVAMRMQMSDSMGTFVMNMSFPFDDVSEIAQFYEEFSKEGAGAEAAMPMGGGGNLFMPGGKFSFKKKKLIREASEAQGASEMLEGEDGEFAKMFFADGTHTTIYHLPGKVKNVTIEGAEIDGKTVTVERPLLEMMEGKSNLEGEIRFKRGWW